MRQDVRELLIDALSELIARDLAYRDEFEPLDKLSDEELHEISNAALHQIEEIEKRTGKPIQELLDDENTLLEELQDIENDLSLGTSLARA